MESTQDNATTAMPANDNNDENKQEDNKSLDNLAKKDDNKETITEIKKDIQLTQSPSLPETTSAEIATSSSIAVASIVTAAVPSSTSLPSSSSSSLPSATTAESARANSPEVTTTATATSTTNTSSQLDKSNSNVNSIIPSEVKEVRNSTENNETIGDSNEVNMNQQTKTQPQFKEKEEVAEEQKHENNENNITVTKSAAENEEIKRTEHEPKESLKSQLTPSPPQPPPLISNANNVISSSTSTNTTAAAAVATTSTAMASSGINNKNNDSVNNVQVTSTATVTTSITTTSATETTAQTVTAESIINSTVDNVCNTNSNSNNNINNNSSSSSSSDNNNKNNNSENTISESRHPLLNEDNQTDMGSLFHRVILYSLKNNYNRRLDENVPLTASSSSSSSLVSAAATSSSSASALLPPPPPTPPAPTIITSSAKTIATTPLSGAHEDIEKDSFEKNENPKIANTKIESITLNKDDSANSTNEFKGGGGDGRDGTGNSGCGVDGGNGQSDKLPLTTKPVIASSKSSQNLDGNGSNNNSFDNNKLNNTSNNNNNDKNQNTIIDINKKCDESLNDNDSSKSNNNSNSNDKYKVLQVVDKQLPADLEQKILSSEQHSKLNEQIQRYNDNINKEIIHTTSTTTVTPTREHQPKFQASTVATVIASKFNKISGSNSSHCGSSSSSSMTTDDNSSNNSSKTMNQRTQGEFGGDSNKLYNFTNVDKDIVNRNKSATLDFRENVTARNIQEPTSVSGDVLTPNKSSLPSHGIDLSQSNAVSVLNASSASSPLSSSSSPPTLDLSKPSKDDKKSSNTSKRNNALYICNPDFSKQIFSSPGVSSVSSRSTSDLSPLHMKTPDFSNIKSTRSYALELQTPNPDFSKGFAPKHTPSPPSQPLQPPPASSSQTSGNDEYYKTNHHLPTSNAINPTKFAELSKKHNYISDLQLKPQTKVPSETTTTSIINSNSLNKRSMNESPHNQQQPPYPLINHHTKDMMTMEEPTAHVIHKNQFVNATLPEQSQKNWNESTHPFHHQYPLTSGNRSEYPSTHMEHLDRRRNAANRNEALPAKDYLPKQMDVKGQEEYNRQQYLSHYYPNPQKEKFTEAFNMQSAKEAKSAYDKQVEFSLKSKEQLLKQEGTTITVKEKERDYIAPPSQSRSHPVEHEMRYQSYRDYKLKQPMESLPPKESSKPTTVYDERPTIDLTKNVASLQNRLPDPSIHRYEIPYKGEGSSPKIQHVDVYSKSHAMPPRGYPEHPGQSKYPPGNSPYISSSNVPHTSSIKNFHQPYPSSASISPSHPSHSTGKHSVNPSPPSHQIPGPQAMQNISKKHQASSQHAMSQSPIPHPGHGQSRSPIQNHLPPTQHGMPPHMMSSKSGMPTMKGPGGLMNPPSNYPSQSSRIISSPHGGLGNSPLNNPSVSPTFLYPSPKTSPSPTHFNRSSAPSPVQHHKSESRSPVQQYMPPSHSPQPQHKMPLHPSSEIEIIPGSRSSYSKKLEGPLSQKYSPADMKNYQHYYPPQGNVEHGKYGYGVPSPQSRSDGKPDAYGSSSSGGSGSHSSSTKIIQSGGSGPPFNEYSNHDMHRSKEMNQSYHRTNATESFPGMKIASSENNLNYYGNPRAQLEVEYRKSDSNLNKGPEYKGMDSSLQISKVRHGSMEQLNNRNSYQQPSVIIDYPQHSRSGSSSNVSGVGVPSPITPPQHQQQPQQPHHPHHLMNTHSTPPGHSNQSAYYTGPEAKKAAYSEVIKHTDHQRNEKMPMHYGEIDKNIYPGGDRNKDMYPNKYPSYPSQKNEPVIMNPRDKMGPSDSVVHKNPSSNYYPSQSSNYYPKPPEQHAPRNKPESKSDEVIITNQKKPQVTVQTISKAVSSTAATSNAAAGPIPLKKESPLDLSVKTVKTKADSTGCDDQHLMSVGGGSRIREVISQVPKVEFTPNFSKHTPVPMDSKNMTNYNMESSSSSRVIQTAPPNEKSPYDNVKVNFPSSKFQDHELHNKHSQPNHRPAVDVYPAVAALPSAQLPPQPHPSRDQAYGRHDMKSAGNAPSPYHHDAHKYPQNVRKEESPRAPNDFNPARPTTSYNQQMPERPYYPKYPEGPHPTMDPSKQGYPQRYSEGPVPPFAAKQYEQQYHYDQNNKHMIPPSAAGPPMHPDDKRKQDSHIPRGYYPNNEKVGATPTSHIPHHSHNNMGSSSNSIPDKYTKDKKAAMDANRRYHEDREYVKSILYNKKPQDTRMTYMPPEMHPISPRKRAAEIYVPNPSIPAKQTKIEPPHVQVYQTNYIPPKQHEVSPRDYNSPSASSSSSTSTQLSSAAAHVEYHNKMVYKPEYPNKAYSPRGPEFHENVAQIIPAPKPVPASNYYPADNKPERIPATSPYANNTDMKYYSDPRSNIHGKPAIPEAPSKPAFNKDTPHLNYAPSSPVPQSFAAYHDRQYYPNAKPEGQNRPDSYPSRHIQNPGPPNAVSNPPAKSNSAPHWYPKDQYYPATGPPPSLPPPTGSSSGDYPKQIDEGLVKPEPYGNNKSYTDIPMKLHAQTFKVESPSVDHPFLSEQKLHNNANKGVDQNIISKLRNNLEMKEIEKQKMMFKQQKSVDGCSEDENIKNEIAARIRTKGELKGFNPVPQTLSSNPPPSLPPKENMPTEEPVIQLTSDPIEPPPDMEGTSAFDLMDWGSACNDFVEQLQTGKKRGRRKRSLRKSQTEIKLENDESAVGNSDLPGTENVGIASVPANIVDSVSRTVKLEESSSDEDKPLLFLRQQTMNMSSTSDLKEERHPSKNDNFQNDGSATFSMRSNAVEKIPRNIREKQRLDLEQKIAARLGKSSSSESEHEIRRLPRSKIRVRKLRTRSSIPMRKTSDDDNTEDDDDEVEVKPDKSKEDTEAKKRKKVDKTSSDSEPINTKKKISRCFSKSDNDKASDLSSDPDDKKKMPLKRTLRSNSKNSRKEIQSDADTKKEENNKNDKQDNSKNTKANKQSGSQQKLKSSNSKKKTPNKERALEKSSSESESNDSDDDSKNDSKRGKKNQKSTRTSKRTRSNASRNDEVIEEEETMTRSKRKQELEKKISNGKVLRNDKIIQNVTVERKPRDFKKAKCDEVKRKILDSDSDCSKSLRGGKKKLRRTSKLKTSSSEESSEESDVETVSERLRPRKQKETIETAANEADTKKTKDKSKTTVADKNSDAKKSVSNKKSNNSKNLPIVPACSDDITKFPPGWEEDFYHYKRSLKVPASLITIGRTAFHRISTSLPDLDPHSSDASETFSEIAKKMNQRNNDTDDSRSKTGDERVQQLKTPSKPVKKEISKSNEKTPDESKKYRSIIDLLHQRITRNVHPNAKKVRPATPIVHVHRSNKSELLETPGAKNDDIFGNLTNNHSTVKRSLFETAILKSRTRTEHKTMKNKELLREVFGCDDRPASAPPLSSETNSETAIEPVEMSFDQKYSEYMDKMNIIDFGENIKKFCINKNDLIGNNGKLKMTDDKDVIDAVGKKNSIADVGRDELDDIPTNVITERDHLITPITFTNIIRTKKARSYRASRRKGSSGFDYIRKKKRPQPQNKDKDNKDNSSNNNNNNCQNNMNNNNNSINNNNFNNSINNINCNSNESFNFPMTKKRLAILNVSEEKEKDENDISKEIRSWVLNKGVGESVLHKASRLGYIDVIAYCLDRLQQAPDPKDNAGYTPLHEACSKGHLDIAHLLLQYGANHSETALAGVRPLHEAVENGFVEIARLLLSYGADPLLATYAGQTPVMLAETTEMEVFLNEHLDDVQNFSANKKTWKIDGQWKLFDSESDGYDLFADIPGFTKQVDKTITNTLNDTITNIVGEQDVVKVNTRNIKKSVKKEEFIKNDAVNVFDNFKGALVVNNRTTANKTVSSNLNKSLQNDAEDIGSDMEESLDEIFEFEESEAPLPPLYLLRDEGQDKWVLLSDLCHLLKVKSKDAVLKQICPSSPPSTVNKDLLKELKMSEFLERAICLQLLCAGEKINIRSSKVVLVRYNDSVRSLLGVQTFLMKI